jgi:hypothetical protein
MDKVYKPRDSECYALVVCYVPGLMFNRPFEQRRRIKIPAIICCFQRVKTNRLSAILLCLFIIYKFVHVSLFVCFRSVGGKE